MKLNINTEMLGKLMVPATAKFRQFQKMFQDSNGKEESFLSKIKRLKIEPHPQVPTRDYRDERREGEDQQSNADYDNGMYEDPREDDNYEPPPSQQAFTTTPVVPPSRGEYLDSCHNRPRRPPWMPLPLKRASKPPPPPPPEPAHQEIDDDYINPDSSNGEDGYIQPTENPPPNSLFKKGKGAGRSLPTLPSRSPSHQPKTDLYEDPHCKENSVILPKSRLNLRRSPPSVQEPTSDDEYEVCDPNNGCVKKPGEDPPPLQPKPVPREKSLKPPLQPRLQLKPRKLESRSLPLERTDIKVPPNILSLELKRPKFPFLHIPPSERSDGQSSADNRTQDEDGDIFKRPWFAATCERKTAEDLLIHLNKDGAFLVRESSGQAGQHPYTLVVFFNSKVYNIPIRFISSTQLFALGREKLGEEHFTSVSKIIENHQRNPLVLIDGQSNSKDATKLLYPVQP